MKQKTYRTKIHNHIQNHKNRKTRRTKAFTAMNCSPSVKGKTPVQNSCFSSDVLVHLKESYNKHNEQKIISSAPSEIWKELKENLSTCDKEECWLNEIKDPLVRKRIDKQIFAPHQPKEWKKNKSAWLSNFDILDVLKQYEESHKHFKIVGPTPIDFDSRPTDFGGKCVWDDLCKFSLKRFIDERITKIGIVFNLDKHNQGGSHWVSMFIDLEDNFVFYLDSAGEKIKPEIKVLADRIIKQASELPNKKHLLFYENYPIEHQMGENECGMYSLFFIITMLTGETGALFNNNKRFSNSMQKIRFFKERRIPDKYMNKYRKIYFNE